MKHMPSQLTLLVKGESMIKLGIYNKDNQIVREKFDPKYELPDRLLYGESEDAVHIGSRKIALQEGDFIRLEVDQPNQYIWVKFDDTFEPSLVYIKDAITWDYQIPFEQLERSALKDTSFTGNGHYIYARYAYDFEISQYRNLALNRHAEYLNKGVYPHASANVETRNDPTFFARNAIDGVWANDDHGAYPYQSWGINQQDDAALTIDFGREIVTDMISITLRCDFPHDTWWNQVSMSFDDGSEAVFETVKTDARQVFKFEAKTITSLTMHSLIKGEPGPFPALTQLEVFGTNK